MQILGGTQPEEDGLVCEGRGCSITLGFLPPRGGQPVEAEAPLGRHRDDRGRVLDVAGVLGEAAGNLWPGRFLH